jgi:hypothetical protein
VCVGQGGVCVAFRIPASTHLHISMTGRGLVSDRIGGRAFLDLYCLPSICATSTPQEFVDVCWAAWASLAHEYPDTCSTLRHKIPLTDAAMVELVLAYAQGAGCEEAGLASFRDARARFAASISTEDWTKTPALMPPALTRKPALPSVLTRLFEDETPPPAAKNGPGHATGAKPPAAAQKLVGPCKDFPCGQLRNWDACKTLLKSIDCMEQFEAFQDWLLHLGSVHLKDPLRDVVAVEPITRLGKFSVMIVCGDGSRTRLTLTALAAKPKDPVRSG